MSEGGASTTRPKRLARILGAQAALWLPALVAVLSVITGIVNIGSMNVSGPLAAYVPPAVERTVGFTGVLTGFLMMAAAYGLRNRLRAAWILTVILLPVTAVQGLAQASQYSYPLVVVSLVSIPTVLANHRLFDREFDLSTAQFASLLAVAGTQAYGTIGSYVLREEFTGIQSVTDAFYFTLVTSSTVGYGEVIPLSTSPQARLFTMSVVVLGVASFGVAITTLIGPAIEARFTNALGIMNDSTLDILDNHIIVVGVSDLTEPVIEELAAATTPPQFVVVTRSADRAQELRAKDIEVVVADPSKVVETLSHPVPVEVLPDAYATVQRSVAALGGEPTLRRGEAKDGPVVTDNGSLVLDCAFGRIDDPERLARRLSTLPGVVEHGLFVDLVDVAYVGTDDGVDLIE